MLLSMSPIYSTKFLLVFKTRISYFIRLILATNYLSHTFVYLVVKLILSFLSLRDQNLALSLCNAHILVILLKERLTSSFITLC